ncbi:methyltransferase domain-containing protein [Spirosoma sp. HMF4905]|uniref:tRNA (guanine(46)-N(7))-methyltransferase n=1 Tax=Spirosoma arboris TaxID=2682092 RepID=A0A7K1SNB9_9BACT|nr:methyltransferase domain-containing protein [Spirosoma arboris]MVM35298.1 methyltransferase domain-containing protein [Spirosoma arboris]
MNLEESSELEIGFGYSCILFKLANIYPTKKFYGVDIENKCFIYDSELEKYKNVKLIQGDIREAIKKFPVYYFERIHIYFPSPGPKQKRYLNKDFIQTIYSYLKKNGTLKIVTDEVNYFLEIQASIMATNFVIVPWTALEFIHNSTLLVSTDCEKKYNSKFFIECKKV